MAPLIGAGSAELSIETVPTLECSGHCASWTVPKAASSSVQAVLPSAALGLIEKPGGKITVVALIEGGAGVLGLCVCGTLRLTSRPVAVSAWVVVGSAERLGLKVGWSPAGVDGH